jgi:hypothetical protein
MKLRFIISFFFLAFLIFIPSLLLAQPPGFDQDTNDVPIDGGLSLLLAAGIGYGIKKKYNKEPTIHKKKPATKV